MKAAGLNFKTAGAAIWLLSLLFFNAAAGASEISITTTVDKNAASLDDYIVLKVAVEGTRDEPSLPDLSAFKVQSRGTSSQMTIVNGRMSSRLEYNYILYPLKTGTFTIGPFTLENGGKKATSNPITITVSPAADQPEESREIFVTASVDNENPYVNQQVLYTFRFYRRVKISRASLSEQPSFDGFLAESLGKENEFQKIINGHQYSVTEIKQALFPLKTGELEISPTTLQADVVVQGRTRRGGDPFFNNSFFGFTETVPRVYRTAPVKVSVKPLPAAGKPADFKNLVGDFSLTSHLGSATAQAGDSVTLTITISGTGSLKNLQSVDLGPLDNFKIYDDKPVFEPAVLKGKIGGKLTVKKALVPLAAGTLTIPAASLTYFDPDVQGYKTITGRTYSLQVSPAAGGEKFAVVSSTGRTGSLKQEIELLGKDILPIHTTTEALYVRSSGPSPYLMLLAALLPAAAFFSLFMLKHVRDRSSGDPGALRRKNAYKVFQKNFTAAERLLGDETRFYPAGAKALKDFIGDRLLIAGQALTSSDLDDILKGRVSPELLKQLKDILDFFDSAQFGFQNISAERRRDILKNMQGIVVQLNRTARI